MKEDLGFFIKHLNKNMKCQGDETLKKYGLTYSQLHVLFVLYENKGCLTQKELEEQLHVSHPTVVGLVKRLEKQGFLTTKVDVKDKRNRLLQITDKAKELDRVLRKGRQAQEKQWLKGLNKEEIEQLKILLHKVLENSQKEVQA